MSAPDPVAAAQRNLERAEAKLADAERERDDARERLDEALAAVGWRRLSGAFSPGVRLYTSVLHPDATLDLPTVLAVLEQQRRAAA